MNNKNKVYLAISLNILFYFILSWLLPNVLEYFHLSHQSDSKENANVISFVILFPFIEELVKFSWCKILQFKDRNLDLIWIISVAYTFTISEAIFHSQFEDTFYIRFILASHILFTLVAVRHNFLLGWLLHGLWNTQIFIHVIDPTYVFILSWILFIFIIRHELIDHEEKHKVLNV